MCLFSIFFPICFRWTSLPVFSLHLCKSRHVQIETPFKDTHWRETLWMWHLSCQIHTIQQPQSSQVCKNFYSYPEIFLIFLILFLNWVFFILPSSDETFPSLVSKIGKNIFQICKIFANIFVKKILGNSYLAGYSAPVRRGESGPVKVNQKIVWNSGFELYSVIKFIYSEKATKFC